MRNLNQKLLFKFVRLPLPWKLRRIISDVLMLLSSRKRLRNSDANDLIINGYKLTSIEDLGIARDEFDILTREISASKVKDQWGETSGEFNLSEVPHSINTGEVILDSYLQKKIKKIGEDLCDNDIIVSYFGGRPQLVEFSSWWSFGGRQERGPQLWHRDIDNIFFLKVFIYLSNVTGEDGPHFFIPKSHRFNKNLGFARYTDEEISKIDGLEASTSIEGLKGSVIIEDTFGFHKGSSPSQNHTRLLLQYQFACFSNP
jgi:hypothetical protein